MRSTPANGHAAVAVNEIMDKSTSRLAVRFRLILLLAVLVPLGLATKFYEGSGSAWVQAHAGGFLYVLFWCFLALVIRPLLSPAVVGVTVFLITSILEFLQLWHPPALQMMRSTFLGQALLGSYFSWSDFPYYAAGAVVAVGIAQLLGRTGSSSRRCGQGLPLVLL